MYFYAVAHSTATSPIRASCEVIILANEDLARCVFTSRLQQQQQKQHVAKERINRLLR